MPAWEGVRSIVPSIFSTPFPQGPLLTIALLMLGGVAPVPRGVVCIGAGAVLGWASFGPAMVGNVLGAAVGFFLGRFVLQNAIQRFVQRRPKLSVFMRAVDLEGWRLVALLRLASPFPGPLLNFASGVSRIGFATFLLASTVGVVPQTLLFIYTGWAGSEALTGHSLWSPNTLILVAGLAVTLYAFFRLKAAVRSGMESMLAADGLRGPDRSIAGGHPSRTWFERENHAGPR